MQLKRVFYDGFEEVLLKDTYDVQIQEWIMDRYHALTYLNRRKFKEGEIEKVEQILHSKKLSIDKLKVILKKVIDEENFCTYYITDNKPTPKKKKKSKGE